MFDLSYGPILLCGLIGLIVLRPDDWLEIAYKAGQWVQKGQAYAQEWQAYFGYAAVTQPDSPSSPSKSPLMGPAQVWAETLSIRHPISMPPL